jgi:anti-sigma B factor antagonist
MNPPISPRQARSADLGSGEETGCSRPRHHGSVLDQGGPTETDWVVIELNGEIDLARADELAQILPACWSPTKNLVIDFSGVTFMDSTGVRWLLETYRKVTGAQRGIRLIVPERSQIERLLAISGFDGQIPIHRN